MRRRTLLTTAAMGSVGLVFGGGVLPLLAAPAPQARAITQTLNYTVLRNDSEVGRHTMVVSTEGDLVKVASTTDIAVKLAMLTLYHFAQKAEEAWRGERLVEFAATTNDDGKVHRVEAKPRAKGLALTVDGKTRLVEPELVPASLWNPILVRQSKLFDTADGAHLNVNARLVGSEDLVVRNQTIHATRFAFTGDMERDIWYDAEGTPLQVAFEAKDGSEIKFVLA